MTIATLEVSGPPETAGVPTSQEIDDRYTKAISSLSGRDESSGRVDNLSLYQSEIGTFPVLGHPQQMSLFQEIEYPALLEQELATHYGETIPFRERRALREARDRSERCRKWFICCNLRLVLKFARQAWRTVNQDHESAVTLLDVIQDGNVALIRAVDLFQWRSGNRFSTYASRWIISAVWQTATGSVHAVHVPQYASDDLHDIRRVRSDLGDHEATLEEIAGKLDLNPRYVGHLFNLGTRAIYMSERELQEPTQAKDEYETIETQDEDHQRSVALFRSMRKIYEKNPREVLTLILRMGIVSGVSMTLLECGEELGTTRERARQCEVEGLRLLRLDPTLKNFL